MSDPKPDQRITDPVWLRAQIAELSAAYAESIAAGMELVARNDDRRRLYLTRVAIHARVKRDLDRILRGETLAEALAENDALAVQLEKEQP